MPSSREAGPVPSVSRKWIAAAAAAVAIFASGRIGALEGGAGGEGTRNFIELHQTYMKWKDGWFGSRGYHRRHLYFLLLDMMGHRIVTGYDYCLLSPELIYERRLRFAFYDGDWLHIEGNVDLKSVKKIIGDDSSLLMTWWRSRKLISVSGILRNYRIDDWEKKVYVVLDDIKVNVPEQGKK